MTRFGKLADPHRADKALTGMALIGLSIIGELWRWVTVTIPVREWGITIMRFVVLRYGVMAAGAAARSRPCCNRWLSPPRYLLPLPGWAHTIAVGDAAALVMTVLTGLTMSDASGCANRRMSGR